MKPNLSDETINGLFRKKVQVIQALRGYRVSEDAVILTWFADPKPCEFILDAGTGCGAIAFGLAVKESSVKVIGLEIQQDLADRAARGVKLNRLEAQVFIVRGDMRTGERLFRHGCFDAIITNPPYHEPGRGRISTQHEKALSRHQLKMPLEDLLAVSHQLLKPQGRFSLIYPAPGQSRVEKAMNQAGFGLSRVLWIHPHEGADPGHVCMESRFSGGSFEFMEGHLYLYDGRHRRTEGAEAILAGEEFAGCWKGLT